MIAAREIQSDPIPAGFIRVSDAAARTGDEVRTLQWRCQEKFEPLGLAQKDAHGNWYISKAADPRLSDLETWEARDARQVGELNKSHGEKEVKRAIRIRDLLINPFQQFRGLSRTDEGLRKEFINQSISNGTFRANGIKPYTPGTFRKIIAAYKKDGLKGLVRMPYSERREAAFGEKARAMFILVKRSGNGITVKHALDQVIGHVIENNWRHEPEWRLPSLRTAQAYWKLGIPAAGKVLIEEGPRKMRAKRIPKIARNALEDFDAGDLLIGDQRVFDFPCRVLGERGWYRVRAKVTCWSDAVSGMIVGWHIGKLANTDTILASFKQACLSMETAPREVIIDNGRDYQAAGGRGNQKKKWDGFDDGRIRSAFEQLGIEVHYALPYQPWAKAIESRFSSLRVFDQFQAGYIGGSPDEKPWDAEKWAKGNIFELPTIDQLREQFPAFIEAYHEEPRRSDSTEGLSPRQAMRQFFTARPRRITRDTLDALCRKMIGPVKVGRDGVKHDRLRYGTRDEAVFKLQGHDVWIAVDPIERDSVMLCDEKGRPLCVANVDRPLGYKSEELREARAHQKRCERLVKEYAPSRDYLLKTTPQQIATRRKLAAQERQIPDADLPPPQQTESVEIVRPDIAASMDRINRAVGAEAMRRLAGVNAAADAVNQPRRHVDFGAMAARDDAAAKEAKPAKRRFVDWAKMAGGGQ
jgi:hypothetical protein